MESISRLWGTVKISGSAARAVAIFTLAIFVAPMMSASQLKTQIQLSKPNYNSLTYEARNFLASLADAQILYFAEHNEWAGYRDGENVFEALRLRPDASSHYAYYCGKDYIPAGESDAGFSYPEPGGDWPFGLYPEITVSDFICMAVGNNDRDSYPDVWMINKYKRPTHLLDDNRNEMLVDILSEPFDPQHFYASEYNDKGLSASNAYIEINLPAYRLDLYEDGRRLKSYPVAIGMLNFKTPVRTFYITHMDWNPWWIPPHAGWCSKKDDDGKEIGCKPVPPGAWNPLGPVKMVMQSSYLIHGTNKPYSIGKRSSHGCIRMRSEDAMDLAWKVMTLSGSKQFVTQKDLYRDKSRNSYRIALLFPVQVNTVYKRLEVLDNSLLFHPDTYGWQPLTSDAVREKLAQFGISIEGDADEGGVAIRANPEKTISLPIKL